MLLIKRKEERQRKCYEQMKKEGELKEGLCYGYVGGDKSTNYLSESCIDCDFLSFNLKNRFKKSALKSRIKKHKTNIFI